MRVFMINSFFSVGGPPRVVKGIYDTLMENGYECVLAAGREKPIEGMNVIKIGTSFNKYWHLFMSRFVDAQGFSSGYATKKLIKQIETYRPDVIHLHNLHGYYINIEILFDYLKRADIPVVWTLHDCWAFTGHCAHFDYIGCERWKTDCYDCPQKIAYPVCNGISRVKQNYHRKRKAFTGVKNMMIVTPSQWLGNLIKESYLKGYPVKVIKNGIDLAVFKPMPSDFREKYRLMNRKIVLGVAQVWGERKGLKTFIELSGKLDLLYQVVLVGLSDRQLKELPVNIIGLKRTKSVDELAQLYSVADVFVNPTMEEVFGLVNIEALACGTPVITYDTGGSIECVSSECGTIVEKGNIEKLLQAIVENCQDGKTLNNNREHAMSFSQVLCNDDYIQLFKDMNKAKRAGMVDQ